MNVIDIERNFKEVVAGSIRIEPEGINRYRVVTPFRFEDGDHLVILLKQEKENWLITDEGHTYMHLTYELDEQDLEEGTRQKIIANALSTFGVNDISGELTVNIGNNQFGNTLFTFIETLLKVSDVDFLSRARIRSTFLEDFKKLITETIPETHVKFGWYDLMHDPTGKYTVDCRINDRKVPLFIYGLLNDDQTRDATISLLQFEKWGLEYRSIGIFENLEDINKKVYAKFTDVCEKEYSNIGGENRNRIGQYLKKI